jgi:hypothetical protein
VNVAAISRREVMLGLAIIHPKVRRPTPTAMTMLMMMPTTRSRMWAGGRVTGVP